jgi:quinol monooxygenase YgiN
MILIAGFVKYAPGAIEKLKGEMLKMVAATRAENGCINYDFAVDVSDPTKLIVFERWRDQKALEGHMSSAHMAAWRKAGAGAGPAERNLAIWEVGEGKTL